MTASIARATKSKYDAKRLIARLPTADFALMPAARLGGWCLDITRIDSTFRPHVKTEPPSVRPLRPAPGQRCERLEDSDRVIRFTDYTDILFDHVFLRLCLRLRSWTYISIVIITVHIVWRWPAVEQLAVACRREATKAGRRVA